MRSERQVPLPKYWGDVFGDSDTRSKKFRVWFGRFSTRFWLMVVESAPVVVFEQFRTLG